MGPQGHDSLMDGGAVAVAHGDPVPGLHRGHSGSVRRERAVEPSGDLLDGRRGHLAEEGLHVHELGLALGDDALDVAFGDAERPGCRAIGSVQDEGMADGRQRGGGGERTQLLLGLRGEDIAGHFGPAVLGPGLAVEEAEEG